MNKFVFNKNVQYVKTSANADESVYVSPKEQEYRKVENEARKKRENVKKRRKQKETFNDAPFAIMLGDHDYDPVTNPNVEPPRYEFIHKDLPKYSGENERGGEYARELKQHLLRSGEYRTISIPRSQYSNAEDADKLLQLAPKGMMGFRLKRPGENISEASEKFFRANQQGKKSRIEGAGTGSDGLDPDSIGNIVSNQKGGAINHLLSLALGSSAHKRGNNLCVCGKTESEHGDEHHQFLPQMVSGNVPGYKQRLASNPLLKSFRKVKDESGKETVKELPAFDEGGPKGTYMPMVHFIGGGDHVKRYTKYEAFRENQQVIGNWENDIYDEHPICACGDGKINSGQNDNVVGCRDCFKGNINMKEGVDSNGNPTLVPHTVGMGAGKLKHVNPSDAPVCTTCNGNRFTEDGTSSRTCPTCNGSGHDMRAINCDNCKSDDSSIRLTKDNVCPYCDGTLIDKTVEGPKKVKLKTPPTHKAADDLYGNALTAMKLSGTGVGASGIDHYSAHRDPNCTKCEDDDQEMLDEHGKPTNLPCDCHNRSASDPTTLPPGTRLFHGPMKKGGKAGFYAPIRMVQNAFRKHYAYGGADNPHEWNHFPNYIDPETGKTTMETYNGKLGTHVEDMQSDKPLDQRHVLGMLQNGIDFSQEDIDTAYRQSQQHWKAPNAHYTAPAKDLELVQGLVEKAHEAPDLLPPYAKNKAQRGTADGRIFRYDPTQFPEHVRDGVKAVEQVMSVIPDGKSGRYNMETDNLYKHMRTGNTTEAEKSANKLSDMIERFNGPTSKKLFTQAISKFPSSQSANVEPEKSEEMANE